MRGRHEHKRAQPNRLPLAVRGGCARANFLWARVVTLKKNRSGIGFHESLLSFACDTRHHGPAHFVSRFIPRLLSRRLAIVAEFRVQSMMVAREKKASGRLMIMFLLSSVGTSAKHQLSEPKPQLASAGMVQAEQRGTQWHHSGLLAGILPAHVVVW